MFEIELKEYASSILLKKRTKQNDDAILKFATTVQTPGFFVLLIIFHLILSFLLSLLIQYLLRSRSGMGILVLVFACGLSYGESLRNALFGL